MATTKHFEEPAASTVKAIPPSSQNEMDQALNTLTTHKDEWAMLDIPGRIALLDQIKQDLSKVENRWITACMAAKGTQAETMAEGEEWWSLNLIYRQIRFLRKALQDIARLGKPQIPGKVTMRPNGQVVAQVVPYDSKEQFAIPGVRAEVWMDPSISIQADGLPQASFYQLKDRKGQVCLVLGTGNMPALAIEDTFHKMFVEGQVVALKMNPIMEYLGPIFRDGFDCLIQAGYLQILYGGAAEGTYLCNHPVVDNVHMTGSDRTFEAIVFGSGAEGIERKQARHPQFTKPFSAELGNISPVIVVPGPWTEKDIKNQAARLGSWLVPNAGCYCLTPRMIIQMKSWEHREALNRGIADFLATIKTRKAYYPGSFELHRQFMEAHPQALKLGEPEEGHLPWTFVVDVDSSNLDDICFKREPFMSLYSETALEAVDVVEFIGKAVEFANERLWGNLVASILVHPASLKDRNIAAAVDQAIADLRYGSIVINDMGLMAYYMKITPWGAYPGSELHNIQSGIGLVNNPLMFDRVQKSVIYSSFAPMADTFLANLTDNYLVFRQSTRYFFDPSVRNLSNLIWRAMTVKKA
jgi:acyl-CoA reductase-like NAD-dependent aldehyde dehydrogenase